MTDLRVAYVRRAGADDTGPVFGSGYLVADRLVLTAGHVAGAVGESVEVFLGAQSVAGTVLWCASASNEYPAPPDAALISIVDADYCPAGLPPVRWGWIVGRGHPIYCTATGFPDARVSQEGRAEPEQMRGEIMPLTRDSSGLIDIRPVSWPRSGQDSGRPWSGMSGATVLSESGELIIAIVVETSENFDRLAGLEIAALRDNSSFIEVVEQHTDRPFQLEPVELEECLSPWLAPVRPQSPIALLRPEYEIAPFRGRTQMLSRLVSWCESDGQVSGILLHAPGGTGKTRFARELANTLYREGWVIGELSDAAATFKKLTQLGHRALVIVDYAESRASTTAALLKHLAEHPGQHSVRVLMLARSAGLWWEQILNDVTVARIIQHAPCELAGLEFDPGSGSELSDLAAAFTTALDRVPGYENRTDHTPAFQLPWFRKPPTSETVLSLHIDILASILARADGDEEKLASPAHILVSHERDYWRRLADERSLGYPETRDVALVFGLMCGAHSRQQAALTVGLLPGFRSEPAEEARRALASWVAALYPPTDPRTEYWGQLAPDWLFEYLLAATVAEEPDFLDNLASVDGTMTRLTGAQLGRAIAVLTASAAHAGEAAAVVRQKLVELVVIHNGVFIPYACHVGAQSPSSEPLLKALQVLVMHPAAELSHLYEIRRFMPPAGGVFADLGVAVQQRIVAALKACGEEAEERRTELARELQLLGAYLAKARRVEEAIAASGEAVTLLRPGDTGGAVTLELAIALTNHATNLGRDGLREESYQNSQLVVDLMDQSEPPQGDARRLLTAALNNIFLYHEQKGHTQQASTALTRAISLHREHLRDNPVGRFELDGLAQLLMNQARLLEDLGRPAEAIAAHEECVVAWRRLYHAEPGVYADPFQEQAILLGQTLEAAGHHAQAAKLYGEAVEALERLALGDPKAQFRLGGALVLQAQANSHTSAPSASTVHLLQRSCAVMGQAFRHDPGVTAASYSETLKYFIQGAQLVAENIDIRPYMAEVAVVLDYLVTQWEVAGQIPDEEMGLTNLVMYMSWASRRGEDLNSAVQLCARVEAIDSGNPDPSNLFDRETLRSITMMLRAQAMARQGDATEAAELAEGAAERLTSRSGPGSHWPAIVACDGLLDVALHLPGSATPDPAADRHAIALHEQGRTIAMRHLAGAPSESARFLANHLVHQAHRHGRLGEHETAAALLAQGLEHARSLSDEQEAEVDMCFHAFDIRGHQAGPSQDESLDEILSMYIEELQALGQTEEWLTAVAELAELRRRRWETDRHPDNGFSYASISHFQATALQTSGQVEAATIAARSALAVAKDLPVTERQAQGARATLLHEIALVLLRAGAVVDAVTSIRACVEIYRGDYEPSAREQAASLSDLSAILAAAEQTIESIAIGNQALPLWRALAAADPDHRDGLIACLFNQSKIRMMVGQESEARQLSMELEATVTVERESRDDG